MRNEIIKPHSSKDPKIILFFKIVLLSNGQLKIYNKIEINVKTMRNAKHINIHKII
jgi:hypothetical protein